MIFDTTCEYNMYQYAYGMTTRKNTVTREHTRITIRSLRGYCFTFENLRHPPKEYEGHFISRDVEEFLIIYKVDRITDVYYDFIRIGKVVRGKNHLVRNGKREIIITTGVNHTTSVPNVCTIILALCRKGTVI